MVKVPLYDNIKRFIRIDPKATEGAVLGQNLRLPDGTVLRPEQVINQPPASDEPVLAVTIWRYIREIPNNIRKIAALAGVGFPTRDAAGDWFQREIEVGPLLAISDAAGEAANPRITTEAIVHTEASAVTPWTINHNVGRRVNVGVYTAGGVEVIAEVLLASDNQAIVTFDAPMAGYAVID